MHSIARSQEIHRSADRLVMTHENGCRCDEDKALRTRIQETEGRERRGEVSRICKTKACLARAPTRQSASPLGIYGLRRKRSLHIANCITRCRWRQNDPDDQVMAVNSTTHAQIATTLLQKHSLPISPTWLNTQLSAPRSGPTPPLPSLTQTALFRLLASDFTASLVKTSPKSLFPTDLNDPNTKERRLSGDVPVQLLSVEDIGSSKWSQIEAIERVERGEEVRGREIVRTVDVDSADARGGAAGAASTTPLSSRGPHKYVLQDANGTKVVAWEKEKIQKMGLGDKECVIGMKVVLKKGSVVRRGLVMLEKGQVNVLGGKVEAWDEAWKKGAKKRLMDAVSGNGP